MIDVCEFGSKLFDTMIVFLKEIFKKVDFEKNPQMTKKHAKLPKELNDLGSSDEILGKGLDIVKSDI